MGGSDGSYRGHISVIWVVKYLDDWHEYPMSNNRNHPVGQLTRPHRRSVDSGCHQSFQKIWFICSVALDCGDKWRCQWDGYGLRISSGGNENVNCKELLYGANIKGRLKYNTPVETGGPA